MILSTSMADIQNAAFDRVLVESYDQVEKKGERLFTVDTDDSAKVESSSITSLGIWEEIEEANPITEEDAIQMYNVSYTHKKYGKAMKLSQEAVDDDEHGTLKKLDGEAGMIGRGSGWRTERLMADIFNNHITTAGADGVTLCSATHPKNPNEATTYYINYMSGAGTTLDHDSIEDLEIIRYAGLKDPKGGFIPVPPKGILLVPPALEGTADRMVSERATKRPGELINDINRYAGKYEPMTWQYLDSSTTAWWIVYPEMMGLRFYWRRKPSFDNYWDPKTESIVFNGKMRCSVGWEGWGYKAVWGSKGAA